jgi:ribosomal-protein-alanine N-acetyltransferase
MIGTVGFSELDMANHTAEIGYVINPKYSGKGIATEAVSSFLNFAFMELDMERVEGRYMVPNHASRRVMEKCGMQYEGILRSLMEVKGVRRDIGICSILKEEYFAKKHFGGRLGNEEKST